MKSVTTLRIRNLALAGEPTSEATLPRQGLRWSRSFVRLEHLGRSFFSFLSSVEVPVEAYQRQTMLLHQSPHHSRDFFCKSRAEKRSRRSRNAPAQFKRKWVRLGSARFWARNSMKSSASRRRSGGNELSFSTVVIRAILKENSSRERVKSPTRFLPQFTAGLSEPPNLADCQTP